MQRIEPNFKYVFDYGQQISVENDNISKDWDFVELV